MKSSLIILIVLLTSCGLLNAQENKNSSGGNFIYPQFHENFSAEESWEIHKQAYQKQLKAAGLSESEIQKKLIDYENEKKLFIEKVKKQSEEAALQRKEAEILRKQAEEQRKQADILRKQAEIQRQQAEEMRKQAEQARNESALEREKAEEQRKQAMAQKEIAEKQREVAAEQRKVAEEMRKLAEIQRKKAEEIRNSFENILTKNLEISKSSTKIDPITINIEKKTTIYFSVHSRLNSGNILIEIFNPKGGKEAELSLEHKQKSGVVIADDFSKYTNGSINKTIADADAGDWQIKITPKQSEGNVNISVGRYIKPATDE
jgi:DNA polymerase III alpha subunit (gram-positive type)